MSGVADENPVGLCLNTINTSFHENILNSGIVWSGLVIGGAVQVTTCTKLDKPASSLFVSDSVQWDTTTGIVINGGVVSVWRSGSTTLAG
ncbi:TPA: hypothetical protein OMU28_002139 [Klebsiella aerogenes]|nr:hypothetical protein [Klebsiella aerogenes]